MDEEATDETTCGSGRARRGATGWLTLLAVSLVPSCQSQPGGSRPAPDASAEARAATRASSAASPSSRPSALAPAEGPPRGELSLSLRPRLQPRAGVSVIVELTGPVVGDVRALGMTPRWAGIEGPANVRELVVDDARGSLAACPALDAGRCPLGRPPEGARLRVSYFAAASEPASRLDLDVGPNGLVGVGHTFLVVPEIDELLTVRLRWDLAELGTSATGASSYGVGHDVLAQARPSDVANSIYLAGELAVHDGGFNERLVALGAPAFDLGEATRFFSDALDAARRAFEVSDRKPFTLVLLPRPHMGGDHDGVHLHQSVALWFDQDRRFDPQLRVLTMHEIVHRWIGGELALVEPGGGEAIWFTEGFTTHYARELLHRRGLLSHREFVAELNRSVEREQRAHDPRPAPEPTGPLAMLEPAGSGKPSVGPPVDAALHDPTVIHHGALYAALLDAELERQASQTLPALLQELANRAERSHRRLEVTALRARVAELLGPAAGDELDRLMLQGEGPIDPPAGAFGPCVVRMLSKEARYELGFDPESISSDPPLVRGLVPQSAAERAGLRDGDLLISGHRQIRLGDAAQSVSLVVKGARGMRIVRYSPNAAPYRVHWEVSSRCR